MRSQRSRWRKLTLFEKIVVVQPLQVARLKESEQRSLEELHLTKLDVKKKQVISSSTVLSREKLLGIIRDATDVATYLIGVGTAS
jgi:hypothetical protein